MARYFDPHVISRVQGYDVRARRVVEGFLVGVHKSPFLGTGLEFKQHRQYVQGDDLRYLDWRVYAKTDHLFVKQFEWETNMPCQFVIDCSESMAYRGGSPMSKFEYAATAAASLAYLLLLQRDAVGFTFFDDKVRAHIPPRATYAQFNHAMTTMEEITPGAKTMTGETLMAVGANLTRRGMVILLTDFLDDIDPIALGLNRLCFDGHEVVAICVADPYELQFPFSGPSVIDGMEETGELRCDPSDYREVYLESRAEHIAELRAVCRRLQFDLVELDTSRPLGEALSEMLLQRQQTATR
ncbi:MAG: DUF58 domain-containing protein [Planctomycetota bacterium]